MKKTWDELPEGVKATIELLSRAIRGGGPLFVDNTGSNDANDTLSLFTSTPSHSIDGTPIIHELCQLLPQPFNEEELSERTPAIYPSKAIH